MADTVVGGAALMGDDYYPEAVAWKKMIVSKLDDSDFLKGKITFDWAAKAHWTGGTWSLSDADISLLKTLDSYDTLDQMAAGVISEWVSSDS